MRKSVPLGDRQVDASGYVRIYVGRGNPHALASGWALEHRVIIGDMIGRSLLREETVHHVNGDRQDNRPQNLELWSHSQPKGQRVVDKIKWAKALLALYDEVGAQLKTATKCASD